MSQRHHSLRIVLLIVLCTLPSALGFLKNYFTQSTREPKFAAVFPEENYSVVFGEALQVVCASYQLKLNVECPIYRYDTNETINKCSLAKYPYKSKERVYEWEPFLPEHEGTYRCRTEGDVGEINFTISGTGDVPPLPVFAPTNLVLRTRDNVTLAYTVPGGGLQEDPELTCSPDKDTVPPPTTVDLAFQHPYLREKYPEDNSIKDVKILLNASAVALDSNPISEQVSCTVTNILGSTTAEVHVMEGSHPSLRFIKDSQSVQRLSVMMAAAGQPLGSYKLCWKVSNASRNCTTGDFDPDKERRGHGNISHKGRNVGQLVYRWQPPQRLGCEASVIWNITGSIGDSKTRLRLYLIVKNPFKKLINTTRKTVLVYDTKNTSHAEGNVMVCSDGASVTTPTTVPVKNVTNTTDQSDDDINEELSTPTPPISSVAVYAIAIAVALVVMLILVLALAMYLKYRNSYPMLRKGKRDPPCVKEESREEEDSAADRSSGESRKRYTSLRLDRLPLPTTLQYQDVVEVRGEPFRINPETMAKYAVDIEQVRFAEEIGRGAFGVVHRGVVYNLEATQLSTEVALKWSKDPSEVSSLIEVGKEIYTLWELGQRAHPNVISMLGISFTESSPVLILEYASRGSLLTLLRSRRGASARKQKLCRLDSVTSDDGYGGSPKSGRRAFHNFNAFTTMPVSPDLLRPDDVFRFCWQIAKGMDYLTSRHFIHRDLAARNVLITHDFTLKISDFGHSRTVESTDGIYTNPNNRHVPVRWYPIEALTSGTYTVNSDIWSFGVVMWEIATLGCTPYPEIETKNLLQMLNVGHRMKEPIRCPEHMYNMMLDCWREQPEHRPSFDDLIEQFDELLEAAAKETTGVEYVSLGIEDELKIAECIKHRKLARTQSTDSQRQRVLLPDTTGCTMLSEMPVSELELGETEEGGEYIGLCTEEESEGEGQLNTGKLGTVATPAQTVLLPKSSGSTMPAQASEPERLEDQSGCPNVTGSTQTISSVDGEE